MLFVTTVISTADADSEPTTNPVSSFGVCGPEVVRPEPDDFSDSPVLVADDTPIEPEEPDTAMSMLLGIIEDEDAPGMRRGVKTGRDGGRDGRGTPERSSLPAMNEETELRVGCTIDVDAAGISKRGRRYGAREAADPEEYDTGNGEGNGMIRVEAAALDVDVR